MSGVTGEEIWLKWWEEGGAKREYLTVHEGRLLPPSDCPATKVSCRAPEAFPQMMFPGERILSTANTW